MAVSDRCAICSQVETFSYVFCECTHSPAVWTWIVAILNKLYAKPLVFSPALVLFKQGLPAGARASRSNELTRVLINITLNALWAARNLRTFESIPTDAQTIIQQIKYKISTRIRAAYHFNSTQDFLSSWGHQNVLCEVRDKQLYINL